MDIQLRKSSMGPPCPTQYANNKSKSRDVFLAAFLSKRIGEFFPSGSSLCRRISTVFFPCSDFFASELTVFGSPLTIQSSHLGGSSDASHESADSPSSVVCEVKKIFLRRLTDSKVPTDPSTVGVMVLL